MILVTCILLAALAGAVTAAAAARPAAPRLRRLETAAGALALGALAALVLGTAVQVPDAADGDLRPFAGRLVDQPYLRLVVGAWAVQALGLAGLGALAGGPRRAVPATLLAIAATAFALGAVDDVAAIGAAIIAGIAVLHAVLEAPGLPGLAAAGREVRLAATGGVMVLAGAVVAGLLAAVSFVAPTGEGGDVTGPAALGGAALLVIALGTAMRSAALPFHLRVPRAADALHPLALPLVLAWGPLALAAAALAAIDRQLVPLELPVEAERTFLLGVALLTMTGAALAAWVQDDLRHLAGYLVVADTGVLLLALATPDPAAWGPGRAWLLVLATTKTGVLAWAATTEHRFGTRDVRELAGWCRAAPLLGLAFAATAVASVGLPGLLAWDARAALAEAAAPGAGPLLVLAGLAVAPAWARLLLRGLAPAGMHVADATWEVPALAPGAVRVRGSAMLAPEPPASARRRTKARSAAAPAPEPPTAGSWRTRVPWRTLAASALVLGIAGAGVAVGLGPDAVREAAAAPAPVVAPSAGD